MRPYEINFLKDFNPKGYIKNYTEEYYTKRYKKVKYI